MSLQGARNGDGQPASRVNASDNMIWNTGLDVSGVVPGRAGGGRAARAAAVVQAAAAARVGHPAVSGGAATGGKGLPAMWTLETALETVRMAADATRAPQAAREPTAAPAAMATSVRRAARDSEAWALPEAAVPAAPAGQSEPQPLTAVRAKAAGAAAAREAPGCSATAIPGRRLPLPAPRVVTPPQALPAVMAVRVVWAAMPSFTRLPMTCFWRRALAAVVAAVAAAARARQGGGKGGGGSSGGRRRRRIGLTGLSELWRLHERRGRQGR